MRLHRAATNVVRLLLNSMMLSAPHVLWQRLCTQMCGITSIMVLLFLSVPLAAAEDKYTQLAAAVGAPGAAVIEFDTSGVTAEHYLGVDGDGIPTTADTRFVWGSVTKSFTAVLILDLAEQGRLDLNAPVTEYLPEFSGTTFGNSRAKVTDLIHHTAGLPNNLPTAFTSPNNFDVIAEIAALSLVGTVGDYVYSNLGYQLLQIIAQRVSGVESYSQLLNNTVMVSTGSTPVIADNQSIQAEVPEGFIPFFTARTTRPVLVSGNNFGAHGLAGTGQQLATYGVWQLNQHRYRLVPSTFPRTSTGQESVDYGAGLRYRSSRRIATKEPVEIVEHTGSEISYASYFGFDPAAGKGLVMLFNQNGFRMIEDHKVNSTFAQFYNDYFGILAEEDVSETSLTFTYAVYGLTTVNFLSAVLLIWVVWRWYTRGVPQRPLDKSILRIGAAIYCGMFGILVTVALFPVVFDHPLFLIARGLPDGYLLVWSVSVTIFLTAAAVIVREIMGITKHRKHSQSQW